MKSVFLKSRDLEEISMKNNNVVSSVGAQTSSENEMCYSRRVILLFSVLSAIFLVSGILAIVLSENAILKGVLGFVFGGFFSVTLRSLSAELIQYFRSKKKNCQGKCTIDKSTNS